MESTTQGTATQGDDAYGFLKARLQSASPTEAGCDYVKIEFLSEAQLSRVEIDHGRVD